MSKDILTRLQEKYNRGDLSYHTSSKLVYSYDLLWFFEQAERVQDLEGKITTLYEENCRLKNINTKHIEIKNEMYVDLKHARRNNKRYFEAIKKAISHFNQDEHFDGMAELQKVLSESK